jgi:acyl-CoA dehydrogenase
MNGHSTCRPTTRVSESSNLSVTSVDSNHSALTFTDVFVPDTAILGTVGHGLAIAQTFVHENRLRQAASSLGAAEYCIEESIKYARRRKPFGKELSTNQGIQFPIVELATQVSQFPS